MSWCIDEIEFVLFTFVGVLHRHRRCFDGDAAFALEVHRIEQLRARFACTHCVRSLQEAIGERALTVVDMSDDGKVTDLHWNWAV